MDKMCVLSKCLRFLVFLFCFPLTHCKRQKRKAHSSYLNYFTPCFPDEDMMMMDEVLCLSVTHTLHVFSS